MVFAAGHNNLRTDRLEDIVLRRLKARSEQLLELLRVDAVESLIGPDDQTDIFFHDSEGYLYEPPTLYGIVVKEAVVALVAYEPLSNRDAFRTIAFFHLSKPHYDVWNALALAMVMIHCRNHLLKIKERLPEGMYEEVEAEVEDEE